MDDTPFITVMILCYNCAHLVNNALNAIAKQTFHDFELLFIDNGSTDNSREIYDTFVKKHPELFSRIVTIQTNKGPTHGWNEGLKEANGEYVLFNDADDWMDEDCLLLLAEKARETDADRVTGQYREVAQDGRIIRERTIVSEKSRRLPTAMLQGTLFRRSVFLKNRISFPEGTNVIAYDFEIVFRFASLETRCGAVVQKTIYNYLVHSASVIQKSGSMDRSLYYLENVTKPLIKMTAKIVDESADQELNNRMIYLVTRNYYSRILSLYQTLHQDKARMISQKMQTLMKNELASYKNNPYLRPFCNGYEQPGSLLVWMMSLLEKTHLINWVAKIVSTRVQNTRYFR